MTEEPGVLGDQTGGVCAERTASRKEVQQVRLAWESRSPQTSKGKRVKREGEVGDWWSGGGWSPEKSSGKEE